MSKAKEKTRSSDVESELIEDAKNGSAEAFDKLMSIHQNEIFKLAYRMLDNRDDALDVVQDTFYRAYRSLKKFRGDSGFRLYLEKIATNLCISRYRRKKIFTEVENIIGLGKSPNWDDSIDADAHKKMISQAMNTLTPRERAAFVLRFEQKLSVGDSAKVMKVTEGTVKTLTHRATEKMRKVLRGKIANF